MIITKQIEIDMGHRIPNHNGKCKNLHGHRYKIVLGVEGDLEEKGSNEGMVLDFGELKKVLIETIDNKYDHSFVLYSNDKYLKCFKEMHLDGLNINFVNFIPTAENLAKHFYEILKPILEKRNINISFLEVHETPTSMARYTGEK